MQKTRRGLLTLAAACAAVLSFASIDTAEAARRKPQLMFVQTAEDIKADPAAKKLRLVNVSQQTIYFADRPVRLAGHITLADYMKEWTSKAGKDNFGKDPPNAALSVYEPGQANNSLVIVEILNPKIEGKDLVYDYKVIKGQVPAAGGQTSLFIDWIGVGGEVGPASMEWAWACAARVFADLHPVAPWG